MAASIRTWIDQGRMPDDYYELLGRSRFDPNYSEILEDIRAAVREVIALQNHQDRQVAKKAVQLQNDLGRAEGTFSSAEKLRKYDGELFERICEEFKKTPIVSSSNPAAETIQPTLPFSEKSAGAENVNEGAEDTPAEETRQEETSDSGETDDENKRNL